VVGLVIVVTVVAIEAMSVATVMPTVVRDLHGLRFYSWGFTAYLLADVIGMVDAGRRSDQQGPTPSLIGGLVMFAIGLLIASLAPDMAVFLGGRLLQGLGGGSMIVAVYVVVARAFPESLHPRVFAALSSAWVVPALVGPALAGVVTSAFGWRWVFAGIAPFAIAGAAMLAPVLRQMTHEPADTAPAITSVWPGVALAVGLGAIQGAAEADAWWAVPVAVVGLGISVPTLRRLLPAGALRLARGLPTVVVLRGVLTCAFFGAESYLPFTLTRVHGGTARVVGIPLTLAALGWSAGSWWQGRTQRPKVRLLQAGFGLAAVGIGLLVIVAQPGVSLWVAVPIWTVAGTGMGLAMPTISVLLLERSSARDQGANSAALQISDMVGSIVGIAALGAIVTGLGLHHVTTAVTIGDLILAGVAVCGVFVAGRSRIS
jgi:MFS family permease